MVGEGSFVQGGPRALSFEDAPEREKMERRRRDVWLILFI